jgi:NAD(P)-dependent dehydrogenase (short-subunit alcohol dehydrogenase family)
MTLAPTHRVAPYPAQVTAILGGTSGVGLSAALQLASLGARRFVLNGRNAERGEAALASLRDVAPDVQVAFVAGDVGDPETSARLIALATERFGGLDGLVVSAGGNYPPRILEQLPRADAEGIVREYLMGAIHALQAAIPAMKARGGGSIVTVASDAAKVATPGESVIGAALAGMVMLTRVAAIENTRHGIRVNAVTPSIIQGTRTYEMVMSDPFSQRLFGKAHERARLGVATADDVAATVVFLLGPGAARLTGQAISVNGGISVA